MRHPTALFLLTAIPSLLTTYVDAQTLFECKDASENVRFSDRACTGLVRAVPAPSDPVSADSKAASDARVQNDKALANRIEANRLATEQAARAAQDQQVQASKAADSKVEQERAQKSSSTSALQPSGSVFTPPNQ